MRFRVCVAGALSMLLALAGIARADTPHWGGRYIPNVPVVTQDGKALRFYDDVLKGKIAVISFIYTSCRDICPLVTARLSQVEDRLGDSVGRDIVFVSISIDPVTDTPEKLKEFANAFGVGGAGWVFLTGKPEDIDAIRHKLGERTRDKTEHGSAVMLYNDATGDWERSSAFGDLNVLAHTIRAMDPTYRNQFSRNEAPAPVPAMRPADTATRMANMIPADAASNAPAADSTELPGQELFTKACSGCHTIGRGDKVGPDLKGLMARRDRDWVIRYMTAPDKMRSDPIAASLAARFGAVRMPNLGLSENDAGDLIGFLQMQTYAMDADKAAGMEHDHSHHQH